MEPVASRPAWKVGPQGHHKYPARDPSSIHLLPKKRPGITPGLDRQAITMEANLPAVASTAAAPTAATAAKAAATAARTSTTASAGLVLSFVDAELSATHIVTVQALNGPGCIGLAHFNEPESAWAAGLTIGRQRHGLDRPVLREQCANVRLAGAERQIAYIDFGHKFSHSPNNSKQPEGRVIG